MGDKAAVRELAHIQKIVVQDLDEQAVPSEIVGAIEGITGAKTEEIRVISTWDLSRGQKWAIISLPAHFASKLLTAGRLRVGYTNCRVRFWEERRRGRCPKCTEPDRRNCCRVCGANGLYESSCETSEEAKAIFKAELAQQQIGGGSGNKQPKEHADLALATANEKAVDIILVSEQYRNKEEEEGWYPDAGGRAAIAVLGRHQIDVIGPCLSGLRWIETNGLRLFSCYCSPNVPFTEFETFLRRLEISIREAKGPVIVGGDFNAKSQDWGSCKEDNRGKALADLIASLGLTSCNQGNEPTFVRGASESHIDITFASRAVADRVRDWKVLDEESLSLHRYMQYSIAAQRKTYQNPPHTGWAIRKLDRSKLKKALQRVAHVGDQNAEDACNITIRWLTRACVASMPKSATMLSKKKIYNNDAWTAESGSSSSDVGKNASFTTGRQKN
ncbi:hypothetical protein ACI65C_001736 [Semiaphis heraclei]